MSHSFATEEPGSLQFMGFPKQEYWSRLPFTSPGDLPDPGIEPVSPAWQAGSLPLSHLGSPGDSVVKNPPAMQETQVQSLGQEDSLEKEMATHSSILVWGNPTNRGA